MEERITGEEATMAVTPEAVASRESMLPGASTPPRHVFGGRYEILGLVGSGGMGTVYRARDVELDEIVALKLLRRDLLDKPGMLDRFRQEVKLARRVTHRNVARTFDIGEGDGEKFLTMELVEGEALSARIAREGALPLGFVAEVAASMCAGLAAAHEAGIVHRDLKPDNVLIARDGRVVITDFGIARAVFDAGRAATVGLALGTPAYMAPEQVEGATDLDARTDIYALGAMMYECLTGERPWTGDSVWSLAAARLMQPPPDPRVKRPDLPPAAAELVLRCMARKREDRFASAAQAAVALSALTMPAAEARRPSTPPAGPAPLDSGTKTVAVLPFRNTGAKDDDYIAEGLSDDLIDGLSMTPGLRVLARDAVTRAGAQGQGARDLGRELRVDVVVDGSVRRAGEQLRISARVISVADGFQLGQALRSGGQGRPVCLRRGCGCHLRGPYAAAQSTREVRPRRPPRGRHASALDTLSMRLARERRSRDSSSSRRPSRSPERSDDPHRVRERAAAPTHVQQHRAGRRDRRGGEGALLGGEGAGARSAHGRSARDARQPRMGHGQPRGMCASAPRSHSPVSSSSDVNDLFGRMLVEAGQPQRGIALLSAVMAVEPQRNAGS